jgi:hypothetical protein
VINIFTHGFLTTRSESLAAYNNEIKKNKKKEELPLKGGTGYER